MVGAESGWLQIDGGDTGATFLEVARCNVSKSSAAISALGTFSNELFRVDLQAGSYSQMTCFRTHRSQGLLLLHLSFDAAQALQACMTLEAIRDCVGDGFGSAGFDAC